MFFLACVCLFVVCYAALSSAGAGCCGGWWVLWSPRCGAKKLLACAQKCPPGFPAGAYRHVEDRGDWDEERRDYIFFPDGSFTSYILAVHGRHSQTRKYDVGVFIVDTETGIVTCRTVPGHQTASFITAQDFWLSATVPDVAKFQIFSDRALTILEPPDWAVGRRTAKYTAQCANPSAVDTLPNEE